LVRIASGGLVYSEILHQAEFTGGFRADTVDSTIRAGEATVYLQPAGGRGQAGGGAGAGAAGKSAASNGQGGAASAALSLAGNVEHMVATGHVNVEQKGMRATGERLVCTTADQVCMLTGDRSAPPRALDAQGTTLTGAALRFESTCEGGVSVEALGSVSGAPAQRVRTESRVRDAGKKETGKQ
jgi:lipopolysaccharide export system protein LptA